MLMHVQTYLLSLHIFRAIFHYPPILAAVNRVAQIYKKYVESSTEANRHCIIKVNDLSISLQNMCSLFQT